MVMTDDIILRTLNENFTVHGDISVVNGRVSITGSILSGKDSFGASYEQLPVKFDTVSGFCAFGLSGLTTLDGCPKTVGKAFNCNRNKLTDLYGGPVHVVGGYTVSDNKLTSLIGLPLHVGQKFLISIYKEIPTPVLRLVNLVCTELTIFDISHRDQAGNIVTKFWKLANESKLPAKKAIWECQKELIDSGFEYLAKM
jgi:hypothetical protein